MKVTQWAVAVAAQFHNNQPDVAISTRTTTILLAELLLLLGGYFYLRAPDRIMTLPDYLEQCRRRHPRRLQRC